jgi:predicted nucleic acid-binding protein
VVNEDGSDIAAELWASRQPAASSILSYPEGRAALSAARRARRFTASAYAKALSRFEAVQGELRLIGLDRASTHHAGELADRFGLRGYDAVHLATALALVGETAVVTWDRQLRKAASRSGCRVAPEL